MYPVLMRSSYAIPFIGLLLSQHALTVQGAASANLQQDDVGAGTGVHVADFSNLPDSFPAEVYNVPETRLAGTVDVESSNMSPSGESAMHGTYELGPEQILSLAQVIEEEMVRIYIFLLVAHAPWLPAETVLGSELAASISTRLTPAPPVMGRLRPMLHNMCVQLCCDYIILCTAFYI